MCSVATWALIFEKPGHSSSKRWSGSKLLDDAAMAALDRAAPSPPMPESVAPGPLEVQVPFKFVTR